MGNNNNNNNTYNKYYSDPFCIWISTNFLCNIFVCLFYYSSNCFSVDRIEKNEQKRKKVRKKDEYCIQQTYK